MSVPLLELKNLSRIYSTGGQPFRALDNISLRIHAGEMVAVIGPSGSGKSTLMNILGCLDHPSEGSYLIDGRETSTLQNGDLARLRRNHFGFIFQRYHLLSHLGAVQNSEIPAIYAGTKRSERRQRALVLLDRLGLGDRTHHFPGQLSGGQQQRVSVARALMNGGHVILADEPTGALDSKSGEEMMRLLEELHAQGHTIILVTHDAHVAAHAQRIIEMRDGRVIADRINHTPNAKTALASHSTTDCKPAGDTFQALWGRSCEAFRMAGFAMASHRMRTLLTMLGIIIGITAVVCVVALGQGAQQKIVSDINSMGTNVIDIIPGKGWGDSKASSIHTLAPGDLEALKNQPYVDSATPSLSSNVLLRHRNVTASASVTGVSEQYFRVRGLEIDRGTIFSAAEVKELAQVVVIDPNTAEKLFGGNENPLGKIIFLGRLPCRVIGVVNLPFLVPTIMRQIRLLVDDEILLRG